MGIKLPYLTSPGSVSKVLTKIIEARTPERFTLDFLGTKLGFKGGSARPIIPLLKRIGFLTDDGVPTERYKLFRNESTRGKAMADALKQGYSDVFSINEYAQELDRKKFGDLVTQVTGSEKGNSADNLTVSTFFNLKEFADFDADVIDQADEDEIVLTMPSENKKTSSPPPLHSHEEADSLGLNLSYTINLNLPETTDVNVYNAIFEAVRKNLLGRS
ncbi:DUF5343 domain-containing protein [Celeribacter sp.]|uniref:DUF5343 domain-containing protein n=1 Tax=Celeribacter sp. TaxID=1890673 RepID=UPI003A8D9E10